MDVRKATGVETYVNDEPGDPNPGIIVDSTENRGRALTSEQARALAQELVDRADYFDTLMKDPDGVPAEPMWPVEKMVEIIKRARQEIIRDVQRGDLPPHIRNFSTLHDYVDANGYGGFFDDNADAPHATVAWVQETLHAWLSAGGADLPTMTTRQIINVLDKYPDDTYVVGYDPDREYVNFKGIDTTQHDEEVRTMPGDDIHRAALVLDIADDYDSRQF